MVTMALVNLDFVNAFDMVFRKLMLGEVKDICLELLTLLQQAFGLGEIVLYSRASIF